MFADLKQFHFNFLSTFLHLNIFSFNFYLLDERNGKKKEICLNFFVSYYNIFTLHFVTRDHVSKPRYSISNEPIFMPNKLPFLFSLFSIRFKPMINVGSYVILIFKWIGEKVNIFICFCCMFGVNMALEMGCNSTTIHRREFKKTLKSQLSIRHWH